MNIVKWFKNLNFQGKLVVGYLFLALIPMLCVTWYTYFNLRSILLEQSYDNINEEIEKMNQNFSMLLEPCLTTLDILYVDESLCGYLLFPEFAFTAATRRFLLTIIIFSMKM